MFRRTYTRAAAALTLSLIFALMPLGYRALAAPTYDSEVVAPNTETAPDGTGLPAGFQDNDYAGGATAGSANRLQGPTGFAFLPNGDMLVTQQNGLLRLVVNNEVQAGSVINMTNTVWDSGNAGLIDVAVDPAFSTNGYVYLLFTNKDPQEGMLARYTMVGNTINPDTEKVLLTMTADHNSHMVDTVKIADGMIYVSDGDSSPYTTASADSLRAQDPTQTEGKLFRMNMQGQGLPTNPFYDGNPNDTASKVFALGLRNPFRFTVESNGTVLVGDVGWNTWEEIDAVVPGIKNTAAYNFGWPCYEGGEGQSDIQSAFSNFPVCEALDAKGQSAVTAPIYAYMHTTAEPSAAVIGGPIYTGTTFPKAYDNAYFFGDYARSTLSVWMSNGKGGFSSQPVQFEDANTPVDIEVGPDGNLYYLSINEGQIHEISYGSPKSCAVGTYRAAYLMNQLLEGVPAIVRCDDKIDFNWSTTGPFNSGQTTNFAVNWVGKKYFNSGTNTITSTSDDGMDVYIDGKLVLNNWGIHPAKTKTATVSFAAAGYHTVTVNYFQNQGKAVAQLEINGQY